MAKTEYAVAREAYATPLPPTACILLPENPRLRFITFNFDNALQLCCRWKHNHQEFVQWGP